MSVPVPLAELVTAIQRYGFAYLLTVNDDQRVHAVAVSPVTGPQQLRVDGLGRRTQANVRERPNVTLLWPPTDPTDYSLIVDGTAELADGPQPGQQVLLVTPSRAVLHRAAPPAEPGSADGAACVSDCVEVPLTGPTA